MMSPKENSSVEETEGLTAYWEREGGPRPQAAEEVHTGSEDQAGGSQSPGLAADPANWSNP